MTQGYPAPPKPDTGLMGPQNTFGGHGKIWESIFKKKFFFEKKSFFLFFCQGFCKLQYIVNKSDACFVSLVDLLGQMLLELEAERSSSAILASSSATIWV